jgi:hypothetical protein
MTDIISIPNIENYTIEIIDGKLIATPKIIDLFITEENFLKLNLTDAKIKECIISNGDNIISSNTRSVRGILRDTWASMSTSKILQNTTFNFKLENMKGNLGYNWCPKINMSFQNKDANGSRDELIKMLNVNKYNINIKIELKNGTIINFKK